MIAYTYSDRDQLTAEDSSNNANDKTYGYDPNGSQTSVTAGGATTHYLWDLRGRMVGIDLNGDGDSTDAGETTYTYDPAGQRVSETTGTGPTTYYVNDKQNPTGYPQIIEEKSGSTPATATVQRSYIIGLRVEGQSAGANDTYFFIRDGHGSNRGLFGSDGKVWERYDYDAFGNGVDLKHIDKTTLAVSTITLAQAMTVHLFGGDSEYDAASGFSYHDARWREDFRFVSYDSFEADPSSPADLHKYLYAAANPLIGADCSGRFTVVELFTATLIHVGLRSMDAARVSPGVASAYVWISEFSFLAATAIPAALNAVTVGTIGLELSLDIIEAWTAAPPPPPGSIERGRYYEQVTRANLLGNFEGIDDYQPMEKVGTSIRTHDRLTMEDLLGDIEADAKELAAASGRDLKGLDRNGRRVIIPANTMKVRQLVVGVPAARGEWV